MIEEKKYFGIPWHKEFILGPKNKLLRVIWLVLLSGALILPPLMGSLYKMDKLVN